MEIKVALIKAQVSQVQMAADLDIHPSTLSRIVNGWTTPGTELARQIHDYLGVRPGSLRFGRRQRRASPAATRAA